MNVTIHHNPAGETSRNVLGMIRASAVEPTIIEYLKTPPTREEPRRLVKRMGLPLRDVLRQRGTPFGALGRADPTLSLLDAIEAHPIPINRPIVVTAKGVRLCRPSETVLDLIKGHSKNVAARPA